MAFQHLRTRRGQQHVFQNFLVVNVHWVRGWRICSLIDLLRPLFSHLCDEVSVRGWLFWFGYEFCRHGFGDFFRFVLGLERFFDFDDWHCYDSRFWFWIRFDLWLWSFCRLDDWLVLNSLSFFFVSKCWGGHILDDDWCWSNGFDIYHGCVLRTVFLWLDFFFSRVKSFCLKIFCLENLNEIVVWLFRRRVIVALLLYNQFSSALTSSFVLVFLNFIIDLLFLNSFYSLQVFLDVFKILLEDRFYFV